MRIACYCGTTFTTDSDLDVCPSCRTPVSEPRTAVHARGLGGWVAERRQILDSMEWAFANGHGCSMGAKSSSERALVKRVEALDALIEEHSP